MNRLNEYGKMDLTAYNAAAIMNNGVFSIDYGGIKFLGLGGSNMSPDEVVEAVNILIKKIDPKGNLSRKTLYNWEKWGLIPQALYRNGKTTIMPEETVAETYATWVLKNGKYRMVVEQLKTERDKIKKIGEGVFMNEFLMSHGFSGLTLTMAGRVLEQLRVKNGISVESDLLMVWTNKSIDNSKHKKTLSLAPVKLNEEDKVIEQGDFIDIPESIQIFDGERDSK